MDQEAPAEGGREETKAEHNRTNRQVVAGEWRGRYENHAVRIQLQGMGFYCGVYKALGSPTVTASFCGVVFLRFLSRAK